MNSKSEIRLLKDQVQYQEQSVVSKTLINKKTGTVTLFAFDQGQGLSEHTTPYDAMVLILDGKAQVQISSKPYVLDTGEMIVLPADEPHALSAVEKFKMMLTMIR